MMNTGELAEQASVNKITGSMTAISEDSCSTKVHVFMFLFIFIRGLLRVQLI